MLSRREIAAVADDDDEDDASRESELVFSRSSESNRIESATGVAVPTLMGRLGTFLRPLRSCSAMRWQRAEGDSVESSSSLLFFTDDTNSVLRAIAQVGDARVRGAEGKGEAASVDCFTFSGSSC